MKQIKYGIIGCGSHALRSHALPTKEMEELKLEALCDISLENMEKFESELDVQIDKYTDQKEFFNSGIDAVLIGTPDEYHLENLRDTINAGKHAFVEKPLATKKEELTELMEILNLAKEKNLVVTSCHPRRFDPPFMWLKENVNSFEMGKPLSFQFDFSYHKPTEIWKHERGLLLDHANHEIDLMNYVFGHSGFEAHRLIDTYDAYHVVGLREDDISFNFSGTRRLESRQYLEFCKVRCERGELTLDSKRGIVSVYNHDNKKIEEIIIKPTDYPKWGKGTMTNFADAINGKAPNYLSQEDLYVNTAMSVVLSEDKKWKY